MAMRIFGGGLMFGSFLMMPIIVIGTLVKRVPNTEPHFSFGRQRKAAPDAGNAAAQRPQAGGGAVMRMTFKVLIVGGLVGFFAVVTWVVFLPTALWQPERTIIAQGYEGDVARGRTLFFSNGCNYCHTQYVREQDVAMGPRANGGNYTEDDPMILGSERTGPDLSYIGRKRSEQWELKHLQHPRDLSPLSIMPNFAGLSGQDQHDIVAYLFDLGDRNSAAWMIRPYNTTYLNVKGPTPGADDRSPA